MRMNDALEALKRYYGYDSFRPGQKQLVAALLEGRDALGIMPTGAGKSICYQVPSLVLPGLTLVVSPLVALMSDQVRALKAAGARPSYLNSTLTPGQQRVVLERARAGWYQIMYVTPERLATQEFRDFCASLCEPGGIGIPLVAVDEAHCISQWGQDFRPAYLQIASFVQELPVRPRLAAFTATATSRVRDDIETLLQLHNPEVQVTGYDRTNLSFSVAEMSEEEKAHWIEKYARTHADESGIVYCSTRKAVDELSARLDEALSPHGIHVGSYHAGLPAALRSSIQEDFIADKITLMVATNAFGMGIDKPNVRYVIHNNVPESIEAYYQEAGRAGRDGDPASCYLLFNGNDFRIRRFLIDKSQEDDALTPEDAEQARLRRFALLGKMEAYCHATGCLRAFILRYFGDGKALGMQSCGNCSNCTETHVDQDVTECALAALRFAAANNGRFGKSMVADVLHGSRGQRVLERGLDRSPLHGACSKVPLGDVRDVLAQLISYGYLLQTDGQYPVIELGDLGVQALQDEEKFKFALRKRDKKSSTVYRKRGADLLLDDQLADDKDRPGSDADLFERLRALRSELAAERSMPAYIICSDASLRGMCRLRPANRDQLLQVRGIGDKKADDYGQLFLEEIARFERAAAS